MTAEAAALALPPDFRQSAAALRIARGVRRFLWSRGFASVTELPLRNGRRADVAAVGPKGDVWIVEVKSSVADLRADAKWPDYAGHCDRFYFATSPEVPDEIFPAGTGLLVADGFGAAELRSAAIHPLAAATRKEMLVRFARHAALRLHLAADPGLNFADN